MDTDLEMGELPQPCMPTARPLSWWLVLASAVGLWGNVCRSLTFACDELAAAVGSHHLWRQQGKADLRVVDKFREQLKTL